MTDTYTIKPLEFNPEEPRIGKIEIASTPFGTYEVYDYDSETHIAEFRYRNTNFIVRVSRKKGVSMAGAKAACEQHWQETIKQALVKV